MPHALLDTPIGTLRLIADGIALTHVEFAGRYGVTSAGCGELVEGDALAGTLLGEASRQLTRYFEGALRTFDLPLAPRGTAFQQSCWSALQQLPFGAVASYRDIASAIGNPVAVRAVGAANGRNPIPIVIPCHRVIGSNGNLTGFGGGLETKRWLLALEASGHPCPPESATLRYLF